MNHTFFLCSLLINFVYSGDPLWHGILYAITFFLLSLVTALLNGQFQIKCYLVGFRIRTALISAIYRKSLTISPAARKNTSVGEIVNLMAVDAQRSVVI